MADLQKHILFLTSNNLSTNPRCAKEVALALKSGYKVSVVAFTFANWSPEREDTIRQSLQGADFYYLPVDRTFFFDWLISAITTVLCRLICRLYKGSALINSYAFDRRSWLALKFLKHSGVNPDLIIAHNPGMFYPAWKYASSKKINYAIDVEDFHPGEGHSAFRKAIIKQVMQVSAGSALYLSYASPLIREACEKIISRNTENDIVINNYFQEDDFNYCSAEGDKLKLVWFSQHINYNRGLEKYIPLLDSLAQRIEIVLIGARNRTFYENEISKRNHITTMDVLPQKELNKVICNYDIGLALEDATDELNREICLTNKILAYRQAGLYILATQTRAQERYIGENPDAGEMVDEKNFALVIGKLADSKNDIRDSKKERFQTARMFSWEKESLLLQFIWKSLIK